MFIFFFTQSILLYGLALVDSNTLQSQPEVECAKDAIFVGFQTKDAFKGRAFIRGRYSDPNCFTGATLNNSVSLLIPHLDCGVSRERSLNPLGVYIRTKVVISFHPELVRHGDQIFVIQCFYLQDTTTNREPYFLRTNPNPLPSCTYEIQRFGSSGGEGVRFAELGERLVHSWSCETNGDLWCILVHGCYMTNTGVQVVNLTDSLGCTLDPHLIDTINYFSPSLAITRIAASKFPDHPHVRFNCQISASPKLEGVDCRRPKCPSRRKVRDLSNWLKVYKYTQDVGSESISVLDVEESLNELPIQIQNTYPSSKHITSGSHLVCVSSTAFALVVSAIFAVAITTIVIITVLLYQRTFSTVSDYQY